jgi:hypothetical protein
VAAFQLLRHHRNEPQAFLYAFDLLELYAFDLLELNGADLRREPIEVRKATLASILRKRRPGVRLNEHLEHPDGHVVFHHACTLGAEGIVSKRLGSRYRSGRSPDWLKFKNPQAPAVRREACPSSSARPASAPGSTRTARTTPAYTGESVASTRPALRWFWWLTVNSPMTRADRVATLKEAKAQFQKSWDAWKAWAKLEEVP